jgi:hypothetical protein
MSDSKNELTLQWQKRKNKFAVRYLIAVCAMGLLFAGMFLFFYLELMSYKTPERLPTTNTILDVRIYGMDVIGGIFSVVAAAGLALAYVAFGIIACVYAIIAVPSIIGCVGLLKNKKWAPIVVLITSILHLFIFPIGTVIGITGIRFYQKYRVHESFDPAGKVFKVLAITTVAIVLFFKILFSPSKRFYEPTASEPLYDACQTKRFGVKIDIEHQGYQLDVSCKPFGVSWNHIEVYANREKMKYASRNDYDPYESFKISFENGKIPDDTLWFSINVKDTLYQIGYANIRPLNLFGKNFPSDYRIDKDKGTPIAWYEEADSLNIYRNYNYHDDAHIIRLNNKKEAKPINLPPHFLELDKGQLPDIQFEWHKKIQGKITNNKLCGEIQAIARETQTIRVKR